MTIEASRLEPKPAGGGYVFSRIARGDFKKDDRAWRGRKVIMIASWSDWKRYPKAVRGETLEAPIGPGVYEVRYASSGALFAFGAVDNIAQALASITSGSKSFVSWFGRREQAALPDLEYRSFATTTREDAKVAAERLIGRREAFMSHVA